MVVYIHAHDCCLSQQSGFGDLHSLWYVVIDEAMEIVILKYCPGVFFFFSFLYNVSNYNTASKKHPQVCFLSIPNVHIFHIFTFTVYDILVGVWDLNICHVNQAVARVTAMSSRSFSVTSSIWQISSLILPTVQRKWSKSKPLGCTYVSPVRNLVPLH